MMAATHIRPMARDDRLAVACATVTALAVTRERGTPRGPANPNSGTTRAPDLGCTSERIYALDCSAMVYWMGYYGGLRFSVDELLANTVYLADSTHWNDAFTATGADNYDEL
ncbi:MAG: hypothetical protein IPK99_00545 [Flavobacteriales bacterium]|nr:hypothetical protein [Flavobacteriales bacterium]